MSKHWYKKAIKKFIKKREKMILTRDMPSRTIEIKPNEED